MNPLATALDRPSPAALDDLGGDWDDAVLNACRHFCALDESSKEALRADMNADRIWSMIGWARRMATLSVRSDNLVPATMGLVGVSLFDQHEFDAREVLVVRSLLLRAGELIGADPLALVQAAARGTDAPGGAWLRRHGGEYADPAEMGFVERGAGSTFRFEPTDHEWDPETELAEFLDNRA